jgi:TonB family protein
MSNDGAPLVRPLVSCAWLLVLVAGCATDAATYRVGDTGTFQSREQAEQTHGQLMQATVATSQLDAPLKPISTPFPEYPRTFQDANMVGAVRIRFVIEADGRVSNPSVIGSPPAALAAITLHAIMRWRFEPPRRGGGPTRVTAEQTFDFSVK